MFLSLIIIIISLFLSGVEPRAGHLNLAQSSLAYSGDTFLVFALSRSRGGSLSVTGSCSPKRQYEIPYCRSPSGVKADMMWPPT